MKRTNKPVRYLVCALIGVIAIGAIGCGKDQAKDQKEGEPKNDPVALAQSDLQALNSFDVTGSLAYDRSSNNRFSQIFGGFSGQNVRNFIDERIKHYLRESDIVGLSPSYSVHTGWTQLPPTPKDIIAGAANLGMQFWLQGLLDNTTFSLTLANGQNVPIASSRAGVMLFGPAYAEEIEMNGSKLRLSVASRQSILVHEARHSDCNGGISQADISRARQAQSYAKFFDGLQARKCGHLHSLCRTGSLQGLPACDAETWGSYGIQAVFLEAALKNAQAGSTKWQVLNALVIDAKSRLEFDYHVMIHSQTDHPDLTSSGLR
jgi:hypothetical protein